MKRIERTLSIHPYFKIRPGQLDATRALLREFVARTSTEDKVLYYEFTLNGDEVFCREAYVDADGLLTHLANVSAQLDSMARLTDLVRVEVHGPAAELDKLRGPLAGLNPKWYVFECGVPG